MSWITHIFVILGGTGESKAIVASAGILNNLNHGLHIDIVKLCVQTRSWIRRCHQGTCGCGIQTTFDIPLELNAIEALKV